MGGFASVVAREGKGSEDAKRLIECEQKMESLYENIISFQNNFNSNNNKHVCDNEVVVSNFVEFISSGEGAFIINDFYLAGTPHAAINEILATCYCYATRQAKNEPWSCHKIDYIHVQDLKLPLECFKDFLSALFCFAHLFEIYTVIDQSIKGLKMIGRSFLCAEDNLLPLQCFVLEQDIPIKLWDSMFHTVDPLTNQFSGFYEFCQYCTNNGLCPDFYLQSCKIYDITSDEEFATESAPENYGEGMNRTSHEHRVPKDDDESTLKNCFPKLPEIRVCSTTSKGSFRLNDDDSLKESSIDGAKAGQYTVPPIFGLSSERHTESESILLETRGRIRSKAAPEPPGITPQVRKMMESMSSHQPLSVVKPKVFNGRDILSTKRAMKKKYNLFHKYKMDPTMDCNFTPRQFPKHCPQNRHVPLRILASTNCVGIDRIGSVDSSVLDRRRMSLHLQASLLKSEAWSNTQSDILPTEYSQEVDIAEGDLTEGSSTKMILCESSRCTLDKGYGDNNEKQEE